MSTPGLRIQLEDGVGRITLDKPKALHALDEPMCVGMTHALTAWMDAPDVRAVLVDHREGTRGFCAGGDIRLLAESAARDGAAARAFFRAEYQLNALIQGYRKPYIAIMDGVTMGGGVGISVHGCYRVATENTVFAMPETGIGLFPDVGGGWFLPRLPGEIGVWLALTGARLRGADSLRAGIATHYVPSVGLPALKEALCHASDEAAIRSLLAAAHVDPGPAPIDAVRACIDRLFAFNRVEDIVGALESDGADWAAAQAALLKTKSPQTLKVALRQIRQGAALSSFAENMKMEYRIAVRVIMRPDFREGVRATLIDKDGAPNWNPATFEGVTEDLLDDIFAPLPPIEELQL